MKLFLFTLSLISFACAQAMDRSSHLCVKNNTNVICILAIQKRLDRAQGEIQKNAQEERHVEVIFKAEHKFELPAYLFSKGTYDITLNRTYPNFVARLFGRYRKLQKPNEDSTKGSGLSITWSEVPLPAHLFLSIFQRDKVLLGKLISESDSFWSPPIS